MIENAFGQEDAPQALIVYVGQREEWKGNVDNPFRGEAWRVNSVPTILRLKDDARLVDDEINEASLATFIN